nr:uncharacterized protein LOC101416734 isoform X2 [Dasypus novemcinctus]
MKLGQSCNQGEVQNLAGTQPGVPTIRTQTPDLRMDYAGSIGSRDMDYLDPEYDLKNELFKSEIIRYALSDSLRNVHCALMRQRNCLLKQEEEVVKRRMMVKHLRLRQELLASKIFHMKMENLDSNLVHWWKNPIKSFHDLWMGYKGEQGKDAFDWPIKTSYNKVQKERDSSDNEVTFLHSELFQANFTLKQLEKANAKLQSKLLANRTINENLSLQLAFLKPDLQSSEKNIKVLEDEKRKLTLMIKSLKEEREQLLSQKDLLIKALTTQKGCINFVCN